MEIKPSNSLYKRVLLYRLYRLRRTTDKHMSRETGKTKIVIKQMEIPLRCHYFNGKNLIRVLDVLACFSGGAKLQEISEAWAFMKMPSFLERFTLGQYVAVDGMAPSMEEESFVCPKQCNTCWQFVLRLIKAQGQYKTFGIPKKARGEQLAVFPSDEWCFQPLWEFICFWKYNQHVHRRAYRGH